MSWRTGSGAVVVGGQPKLGAGWARLHGGEQATINVGVVGESTTDANDGGYIKVDSPKDRASTVDGRSVSYLEAQEQAPLLDTDAKPAAAGAGVPVAPATSPQTAEEANMSAKEFKKFQEQKKSKAEDVAMHKISVEEVAKLWQTTLTKNGDTWVPFGLTNAEAERRGVTSDGRPVEGAYRAPDPKDPEDKGDKLYCGVNMMKPPPKAPEWKKFLKEMLGPFNLLLWSAGILSFIAYGLDSSVPDNVILGSVLFFVVSATGIFSYIQVSQSDKAMEKFKGMVPTECECYREGQVTKIDPQDLVVGDIVQLKYGDKVPADVRIFALDNFKVDNSSLTGESEPQKRYEDEEPEQPRAIEAGNLAFFTTQVPVGTAKAIVIRVGDTFFFIALSLNPAEWIDAVVFFIGIVVANVPKGLLATVTVCLALCANKVVRKKVLVKNLESVETLGSTSCICSDKTGTLTQNVMTAVHIYYDGGVSRCSDTMDEKITGPDERDRVNVTDKTFQEFWRVAQLCNIAKFVAYFWKGDVPDELKGKCMNLPCQQRSTAGDASESAILKFCDRIATVLVVTVSFELVLIDFLFSTSDNNISTMNPRSSASIPQNAEDMLAISILYMGFYFLVHGYHFHYALCCAVSSCFWCATAWIFWAVSPLLGFGAALLALSKRGSVLLFPRSALVIVGQPLGLERWLHHDVEELRNRYTSDQIKILEQPTLEVMENVVLETDLEFLDVYYLGHGEPDGWLQIDTERIHSSKFVDMFVQWSTNSQAEQPQPHIYLNCCYADDAVAGMVTHPRVKTTMQDVTGIFWTRSAHRGRQRSLGLLEPDSLRNVMETCEHHPFVHHLAELYIQAHERAGTATPDDLKERCSLNLNPNVTTDPDDDLQPTFSDFCALVADLVADVYSLDSLLEFMPWVGSLILCLGFWQNFEWMLLILIIVILTVWTTSEASLFTDLAEHLLQLDSKRMSSDEDAFSAGEVMASEVPQLSPEDKRVVAKILANHKQITERMNGNLRLQVNHKDTGRCMNLYCHVAGFGPVPAMGFLQTVTKNIVSLEGSELMLAVDRTTPYDFPWTKPSQRKLCKALVSHSRPTVVLFGAGCADATFVVVPCLGRRNPIRLLIDGGHSKQRRMGDTPTGGPEVWWPFVQSFFGLDAIIVTHTDSDHIGGISDLADEYTKVKKRLRIKNVLMTAHDVDNFVQLRSYSQWENVRHVFDSAGLLRGVASRDQNNGLLKSWGRKENVRLYIVSPNNTVHKTERDRQDKSNAGKQPVKTKKTKYGVLWPNPASIVSLIMWRANSKSKEWVTMLFTGDAPGEYVVEGLDDLVNKNTDIKDALTGPYGYRVNYMDIPHHGSSNNNPVKLFTSVTASHYGYSYNGRSHAGTMCNGDTLEALIHQHNNVTGQKATVYRTFWRFKEGAAKKFDPNDDRNSKRIGHVTILSLQQHGTPENNRVVINL